MNEDSARTRRSSGRPFRSSLRPPGGGAFPPRLAPSGRPSRAQVVALLSATDKEILQLLTEHRVATTHQVQQFVDVPERTGPIPLGAPVPPRSRRGEPAVRRAGIGAASLVADEGRRRL